MRQADNRAFIIPNLLTLTNPKRITLLLTSDNAYDRDYITVYINLNIFI